ncbi:MAG: plasmid replication initiator TrfA [Pirellulales bacterium]
MNLLEHSISSAGTKVDRETRSVVFRKSDIDPQTKLAVDRSWEVSFSKYGRPTAIDDDVFVALLKVSHDAGFAHKRVEFTRYELCRILGWADNGQNYRKIDAALRRLTGVYIVAINYWYDNQSKGWRDRNFHVLDSSEVFNRERFDQERRARGGKSPRSWVQWSDTMMESFAAGYLRKLDLQEYLSLENPVARKLYRYLGMQFYYRTRLSIDLGALCCEKLGYRRGTELNELRRKVVPAIAELESRGIYGLTHEFQASYGKCAVQFTAAELTRPSARRESRLADTFSPLTERLVTLGISISDAKLAVRTHTSERIVADIEHAEFEDRAGRVKTSKAGMLVTMLKSPTPWPRPKGFEPSATRKARIQAARAGILSAERSRQAQDEHEARRNDAELAAFQAYLANLSSDVRDDLTRRALQNTFFRVRYEEARAKNDELRARQWLDAALFRVWKDRAEVLLP